MFKKHKIIQYIEDKHLKDGGYMFAKVEPSGGLDTYHAIQILKMLGTKPKYPESIRDFFLELEEHEGIDDIVGLYLTVETFKELGYEVARFHSYKTVLDKEKNDLGGFGTIKELYIEATSELQTTYESIVVAQDLSYHLDKQKLKHFILSLQNVDGGFGTHQLSLLPTTHYALASLNELGIAHDGKEAINYLREKEKKIGGFYLEELYWCVTNLHMLKQKPIDIDGILAFLQDCFRDNGGFCRSRNMGISTFEDTFYAVTLLNVLESYGVPVFDKK